VTRAGDLRAAAAAWRDEDPDLRTRAEVDALLVADDVDGLEARFGSRLAFGTAGLRGALGAGPNRMNRAVVIRTTAGLAAWLAERGAAGPVVVARDARHGSEAFAADAAEVLSGAGFDVVVVPGPTPTPLLAFAVRYLGASAGVMITASHNPPQDNGYKLYLDDGAQIVAPVDAEVAAAIDAVGPLATVARDRSRVQEADPDVADAYLDGAVTLLQAGGPREIRAVYTAMHGVGTPLLLAAMEAAGFPAPIPTEEQVDPDPDFPTVAFPNPEEPGALDLALARAEAAGADLVLANDPDADRLAVAVPDPTLRRWRALTGDELGCLLADHVLRQDARPGDAVVTTVVSSRMLARIAAAHGVAHAEALTGFKWVVRAVGPGQRFRFGYEEALGYCVGDLVRDKDGITAALVACELAAGLAAEGRSLLDRLDELARAHGVHATGQRSLRIEGDDWLARVTAAMASLRATPPTEVGGLVVTEVEDLLPGGRLPPSDVLVLSLAGARLVIRPSGTEPKLKCYAEAVVAVSGGELGPAREVASATLERVLGGAEALVSTRVAAAG
jgi:phosphomannomutase